MQKDAHFKVYQASAGAGKTFTLIKEYLKLCLANEGAVGNYKHILAITFTNAAANEMKGKIVNALCEIINSTMVDPNSMEAILMEELGVSDAELKRNAQSLMTCIMHDYSSFGVSTIDAFVQKLSRTFANDLGLPSQYTVSIDTDEVAEAVTENIGLRIRDEKDFLTKVLIDFSNNQFDNERSTAIEKQLAEFVAKLTKEKAYQKDEDNNIKDKVQYQQTLDFLNDYLHNYEQEIKPLVDRFFDLEKKLGVDEELYSYGKNGFVGFIRNLAQGKFEQPGSRFNDVIKNRDCFSKKSLKVIGKQRADEINASLIPVLEEIQDCVKNGMSQYLFYTSQRNLLYLYALRSIIREAFKQLADDEQIVHITEFNKLLNKVMGDFSVPFVYERMGERFHHVFVDEFQDTSILQWQNLLPLIDNGLAEKKMSMVVGDGKQSIYRFRSGEVEQIVRLPKIYALPHDEREAAFLQYEQNLESNFGFTNLDTNYRSFTQVVDFNNAFFESAYHQLSDKLKKVYVDEKPDSEDGVCIFQKKAKKEEGMVQVELYDPLDHPDYCKERVEAIVRELVDQRGYQFEDIAVLTRKKDLGSDIAGYLNDKGIPVISQESVLLKSSNEVQLLVNTLRYLIDDDNVINVANVLYFWKRIKNNSGFKGDISNWFAKVKDIATGKTAIESVMGIGEAGQLKATLSQSTCIYDLCAALMRIYGLDTIRDAFLNYFMEEVFSAQSGIKEGIKDFLTYWDTKQDKLSVQSASGNAVKIMTIHKSKGLEFPVVIYPDAITNLNDKLGRNKPNEEWLRPEELGFDAIPFLDKVLLKLDSTAEKMGGEPAIRFELEKDSNRLDNLNLLYVAFTRAVQRLYVIAKTGKPNVMLDFLKDKADHQVQGSESLVYRFGDPNFRNPKEKASATESAALPDSVSLDWFHAITVDADPTRLWHAESERLQPREWGELVHQILSRIRYPKDTETVLKPYLADGTIDADTAAWIRDMMDQMAQHGQIAAAFQPSAKVKTECEVLYQGQVRRLDRYAELPDAIYLIDYKTGKKDEAHQQQVRTYASALREMTDKEIRPYLVYLSDSGIEVDGVSSPVNAG